MRISPFGIVSRGGPTSLKGWYNIIVFSIGHSLGEFGFVQKKWWGAAL